MTLSQWSYYLHCIDWLVYCTSDFTVLDLLISDRPLSLTFFIFFFHSFLFTFIINFCTLILFKFYVNIRLLFFFSHCFYVGVNRFYVCLNSQILNWTELNWKRLNVRFTDKKYFHLQNLQLFVSYSECCILIIDFSCQVLILKPSQSGDSSFMSEVESPPCLRLFVLRKSFEQILFW